MSEAFSDMPWYLRLFAVMFLAAFAYAPIGIWTTLDRIRHQNDRIISLLVDIKVGRRDLP